MGKLGCAVFLGVLALTACGGGTGTIPTPTPAPTPGPVTFVQSGGFSYKPPTLVFTIAFNGSVCRTVNGGPPLTAQLTATQTTQLFVDVQSAWPLNTLPAAGEVDSPSITVSWKGETSPDIYAGTNATEIALLTDMFNAYQLFPSPSPAP